MAYEIPGFSYTLLAGANFTGSQFRFVDVNANSEAVAPTAEGRVVGVRNNRPNTGQATTVVASGISKVEAGAAIAAGANVTTDAEGRAITADVDALVHGVALESASAEKSVIAVFLKS